MTHEEALNLILSNACGTLSKEEVTSNDGYQEYSIELHCTQFIIIARELGNLKYEIREVKKE